MNPHLPPPPPAQQKYGTYCHVRCITYTVLDGFFPYLAQMITSIRGCITRNDLWPWPISSKSFSCDVVYFMDYIHLWHKYNPWGMTISRSIDQRTMSHAPFEFLWSGEGYPNVSRSRSTICSHDDVIKWKHFPCYWPFVRGIHRWIALTKASDVELWCFLWSASEQTVE